MANFRGGGGYPSRDGLFSRPSQNEAQIAIDMGPAFDYDGEVDSLRGQVSKLKSMARMIGDESAENRKVTESLEEVMESTKLALRRGMKRLNRTFKHSKSNHILFLALFAFFFFIVLAMWTRISSYF